MDRCAILTESTTAEPWTSPEGSDAGRFKDLHPAVHRLFGRAVADSHRTNSLAPLLELSGCAARFDTDPIWRERPATPEEFLSGDLFCGAVYRKSPDALRPLVREMFLEVADISSDTKELVLAGASRWGKSFLAAHLAAYWLHVVGCLRDPQTWLGLAPGTDIYLGVASVTGEQAKKGVYSNVHSLVDAIPWFSANFPRDPELKSELRFPNRVFFTPGSSSTKKVLGLSWLFALVDEANAIIDVGLSKSEKIRGETDRARSLYDELRERIEGSFPNADRHPRPLIVLLGASQFPGDFLSSYIEKNEGRAGVNIVRACFAEWTRVSTNRGLLPISEVRVGDMVDSRDGPRPVLRKWDYGVSDTLRIRTSDGFDLEATPEHRILAITDLRATGGPMGPRGAKLGIRSAVPGRWVELRELRPGHIILSPLRESSVDCKYVPLIGNASELGRIKSGLFLDWKPPETLTDDLAELLGLMWANGNLHKNGVRLSMHKQDIDDALGVCKKVFGVDCPLYRPSDEESATIEISCRWIVRWLRLNGLCKPDIPKAIWESPRSVKAAFLKGLIGADGHVVKGTGRLIFNSKSETLAGDVARLLRSDFGINSSICTRRNHGYGSGDGYKITFLYIRQADEFSSKIGLSLTRKAAELARFNGKKRRLQWIRVDSITASRSKVLDLEVEGDHSYRAEGIWSHNSQWDARGIPTSPGFTVSTGGYGKPARILGPTEAPGPEEETFEVPESYRKRFLENLPSACRQIAGRPISVPDPFIPPAAISSSVRPDMLNVAAWSAVSKIIYTTPETAIVRTEWVDPYPDAPAFAHFDYAVSGCLAAAAVLKPTGRWISITPGHDAPLASPLTSIPEAFPIALFGVQGRPDCQVDLGQFRRLILDLRAHGVDIAKVTLDGWNSKTTVQDLSALGIMSDERSLDREPSAYMSCRLALIHGAIPLPPDPILMMQLGALRQDPRGRKVVTALSKDLPDALAGAYANLLDDAGRRQAVRALADAMGGPEESVSAEAVPEEPDDRSLWRAGIGSMFR